MGLAEVTQRSLTVPRPFNLTKPNPRKLPEPIRIEQVGTSGFSVLWIFSYRRTVLSRQELSVLGPIGVEIQQYLPSSVFPLDLTPVQRHFQRGNFRPSPYHGAKYSLPGIM